MVVISRINELDQNALEPSCVWWFWGWLEYARLFIGAHWWQGWIVEGEYCGTLMAGKSCGGWVLWHIDGRGELWRVSIVAHWWQRGVEEGEYCGTLMARGSCGGCSSWHIDGRGELWRLLIVAHWWQGRAVEAINRDTLMAGVSCGINVLLISYLIMIICATYFQNLFNWRAVIQQSSSLLLTGLYVAVQLTTPQRSIRSGPAHYSSPDYT